MPATRWTERLITAFKSPLVTYELRWATHAPTKSIIERQLDATFDRIPDADTPQTWRLEHRLFPDDRLTLTDDNELHVYRQFNPWVRIVLLTLIAITPLLLTNTIAIPLFFSVAILTASRQHTTRPIPAATETLSDTVHGAIGTLLLLAIVITVTYAIQVADHWIATVLCLIGAGLAATLIYLEDGFPFVSPDLAKRTMTIPFGFLTDALGSTIIFFTTVFFAVVLDRLGTILGSYAEGDTSRGTASIFADMTGGWEGSLTEPTPEMIRASILEVFGQFVWLALGLVTVLFILWMHGAKPRVTALYRYRLQPFHSHVQRGITLLIFITFTGILYTIVAVALAILLYGVTGAYALPTTTLMPLYNLLPPDMTPISATDMLTSLYRTLDYTFAGTVLPARVGSLTFLAVLLWPFLFVALGTCGELLGRPYRALRTLHQSQPAPADIQSLVADTISVRRIDRGGYPDLRPLSLGFGLRKYIIVSDVVVDECEPKELEALLRHEQHHIEERSLGFGAIILSSLLGGANLLPAFYDFRESERKADATAAEAVGAKHVRHAIRRLYDLRAKAGNNPIGLRHPGAIAPSRVRRDASQFAIDASDAIQHARTVLKGYLRAPYQLYFGGVLLETAHMQKSDRLAALRDLDS